LSELIEKNVGSQAIQLVRLRRRAWFKLPDSRVLPGMLTACLPLYAPGNPRRRKALGMRCEIRAARWPRRGRRCSDGECARLHVPTL